MSIKISNIKPLYLRLSSFVFGPYFEVLSFSDRNDKSFTTNVQMVPVKFFDLRNLNFWNILLFDGRVTQFKKMWQLVEPSIRLGHPVTVDASGIVILGVEWGLVPSSVRDFDGFVW